MGPGTHAEKARGPPEIVGDLDNDQGNSFGCGSVAQDCQNKTLMELLRQQSLALNENVRQAQYLASSERQMKATTDQ